MISMQKIGLIAVACGVVFGGIYTHVLFESHTKNTRWRLQTSGISITTAKQFFTWKTPPIERNIGHFLNKKIKLESLPIHQSIYLEDGSIIRISQNLWRIKLEQTTWLLVAEKLSETELTQNLRKQVSYQSDYWVLAKKTEFVSKYLPIPTQAVLILDSRKPTKAWRAWSEKNKIPVIPVASFGEKTVQIQNKKILIQP